MQAREKRIIEAFQRVKTFLEVNPAPSTAGFTEAKAMLDDAVSQLAELSSAQVFGVQLTRAERARLAEAKRKLRHHHMKPIVTIARAQIETTPNIAKALSLPPSGLGVVNLVAAAEAMKDAAALFPETFVTAGRPQDFLEQFDQAIQAVEDAAVGKARTVGTRIGARAGIAQQLRLGRRAVEILDPIVKIAFERNDVALAQWRSARRVHAVPVFFVSDPAPQPVETEAPASELAAQLPAA